MAAIADEQRQFAVFNRLNFNRAEP